MAGRKVTSEPKRRPQTEKAHCPMCGNDKAKNSSNFYQSSSLLYQHNLDKDKRVIMCFCKECVLGLYEQYFAITQDVRSSIYIVCLKLDIPFGEGEFEGTLKEIIKKPSSNPMGIYMKNLNSLGNFNNDLSGFDPVGLLEKENGQGIQSKNQTQNKSINNETIDEKLIKFWGRITGYTKEDYDSLQENYESWIFECKSDTLAEKKLYKQICLQELEIQKLREQNKSVIKETETLQKLMDSANVKPKDINAANDPSNASVLGVIIKDIEQHRPAEFFKDKKLYSDFDGIGDYLNRFVFRPLKNLLTGSRDFDKEFNLEASEGDSDE